jgi:hypothetical protein
VPRRHEVCDELTHTFPIPCAAFREETRASILLQRLEVQAFVLGPKGQKPRGNAALEIGIKDCRGAMESPPSLSAVTVPTAVVG